MLCALKKLAVTADIRENTGRQKGSCNYRDLRAGC